MEFVWPRTLTNCGYAEAQYPKYMRDIVQQVAKAWDDFCALPREIRKQFPYNSDSMGSGYELKETVGENLDQKANFDVSLGHASWLRETARTIGNEVITSFVEGALSVLENLRPVILDFAETVENEACVEGLLQEVRDGHDLWFLRFIDYPAGKKSGEVMATPHVDQSGFTLHLFESVEGLQRYDQEPPTPYTPEKTYQRGWGFVGGRRGITMISVNMQLQLRSQGRLKALCHRVITTNNAPEKGRRSAVCFVGFKNTPKYDKKRHGRLQEFPVGFNYDMPIEQFADLFEQK